MFTYLAGIPTKWPHETILEERLLQVNVVSNILQGFLFFNGSCSCSKPVMTMTCTDGGENNIDLLQTILLTLMNRASYLSITTWEY